MYYIINIDIQFKVPFKDHLQLDSDITDNAQKRINISHIFTLNV